MGMESAIAFLFKPQMNADEERAIDRPYIVII